jgi:hypothetical protein
MDANYLLGTSPHGTTLSLSAGEFQRHLYLIGKTGAGKSTLLENLAVQSLHFDAGFAFIDPHGDTSRRLADSIPPERLRDTIYFDPSDTDYSVGFNLLAAVREEFRPLVAEQVVAVFKSIYADNWGPNLEDILYNAVRLLLDNPGSTLLGIKHVLIDPFYRIRLTRKCADGEVRSFWTDYWDKKSKKQQSEEMRSTLNKVNKLNSNPALRNILGQSTSTIDIKGIMDTGKVLIVNLSKGRLGPQPAHLLGAILVSAFSQAAEQRATVPESDRRDFTLYVDEVQNFTTTSFAAVLSEARKWHLSLVLANQYLDQLPEHLQHAIFGNVGTLIAFRVGVLDAPLIARELGLVNERLVNDTANYEAWIKLLRRNRPTDAIPLKNYPPLAQPRGSLQSVIRRARASYARRRQDVEKSIRRQFGG